MQHPAERHMVIIETEKTGRIELTPNQFDLFLAAALVGLDGFEEDWPEADRLYEIIAKAEKAHTA